MDYIKTIETSFKRTLKEKIPKALNIEIGGRGCVNGYGCFEINAFGREDWETMRSLDIKDFSISTFSESGLVFVEFMIGRTYDETKRELLGK